ncbi:MAG: dihydroneopterin aldolase [Bacteroidales bacterium]|nr:dihydroneopterin aldolase [Bacteroidales bacterium]
MGKIVLEGLEFYAFHGCMDEEQNIGGRYIVDVELHFDIAKSAVSDNLADTINYSEAYRVIRHEMDKPSKLIEHVAGRILKSLMAEFGALNGAVIKLMKINPPVGGKIQSASIVTEKWRGK